MWARHHQAYAWTDVLLAEDTVHVPWYVCLMTSVCVCFCGVRGKGYHGNRKVSLIGKSLLFLSPLGRGDAGRTCAEFLLYAAWHDGRPAPRRAHAPRRARPPPAQSSRP